MSYAASVFNRAGKLKRVAGVDRLLSLAGEYLDAEQVAEIEQAFEFGAKAHEGQKRVSGEPYITHPVAVASVLASMRMDRATVIAAILHDVLEDTPTERSEIADRFGEEVAQLVDGVSKLTQIKFRSKAEAQAENFRKMLLAMVKDIRVILVKLSDRLHNMRTLGVMPPPKRRRIARETLDIYVPIANRLGMNDFRLELEDLGFQAMHPNRYKVLKRRMKKVRSSQKDNLKTITANLEDALGRDNIYADVQGREKHLYSVYRKMKEKSLSFSEVLDVYGFRVIVDKVDTCYRVLGVVHNVYKPVPGRFKDYIAIPKTNGYQSLHTVLFGPGGVPIEVQIRTSDMNKIAEKGIAAHWLYKSGTSAGTSPEVRAREWLRSVMEMQKGSGNSMEFLENVKVDLFPDEVYVFTPQGDIRRLPRGATAVDFAYAVHTDVGNTCVAAKIDRRLAPLRTPLVNGQTVEVITAPGGKPNPTWLNFVTTAKARANIRHYLKNLREEEAIELGRRMLDRALELFGKRIDDLEAADIENVLKDFKLDDFDHLLESIGLGHRPAPLVARRFATDASEQREADQGPLSISGTEGMVVTLARCCHPIPGDDIVGHMSTGRGIVIHRLNCPNISVDRDNTERWIEVQWEKDISRDFTVEVRIEVANQRGVLATVAATIAELGSNIDQVNVQERDGSTSVMNFLFAVKDRRHLAQIMRHIRKMPQVLKVSRTRT
ncbi:MAG: bifunctional GTP diphosphokinase/guanosine-3',5'-bis pyrophosphate 3'-pyrophosphohydrolase [Gammaproteobacteria bacterium]|nr:bifunctional GTP diphosphokinase/guanosine-3',5'-bis pyrophosphate 3'-pyrophosphohydrolase [Gammaproteobacteria bacterium]